MQIYERVNSTKRNAYWKNLEFRDEHNIIQNINESRSNLLITEIRKSALVQWNYRIKNKSFLKTWDDIRLNELIFIRRIISRNIGISKIRNPPT